MLCSIYVLRTYYVLDLCATYVAQKISYVLSGNPFCCLSTENSENWARFKVFESELKKKKRNNVASLVSATSNFLSVLLHCYSRPQETANIVRKEQPNFFSIRKNKNDCAKRACAVPLERCQVCPAGLDVPRAGGDLLGREQGGLPLNEVRVGHAGKISAIINRN